MSTSSILVKRALSKSRGLKMAGGGIKPRNVSEWQKYFKCFQETVQNGDLIECHRDDTGHTHWGMYYGDGQVVHFSSVNSDGDRADVNSFIPGEVISTPLEIVARQSDIRVNNRPTYGGQPRPVQDSLDLINILLSSSGKIPYCRRYFNCEMFVMYLKFDGPPESSLTNLITTVESGDFQKLRDEEGSKEDVLQKLVYLQWWENTSKIFHQQSPRTLLQNAIQSWKEED